MMPSRHSFGEFLTTQSAQISLNDFLINLVLTALVGFVLGRVYVKFGRTLSNRDIFAGNFVVLAMTTMVIITIVKSSLALSLGLVGALSIIRFRAAIKEPEELNYLFLAISAGLGFGASQTVLTLAAFGLIIAVLALRHLVRGRNQRPNFYLTVTSPADPGATLPRIAAVLGEHALGSALTRFDQTPDMLEASFRVEFESLAKLHACNTQLQGLAASVKVSYLEERGVGA